MPWERMNMAGSSTFLEGDDRMQAPTTTSALALAQAIRKRELSPVEAVQHTLNQLDRHDGKLTSIIWRRDEAVLAEAKAAEAILMRGDPLPPFFGVPIPIKDLTEAADQPCTMG